MTKDLGPAVAFPPPLLFVVGLVAGVLLDRRLSLPVVIPDRPMVAVMGGALVVGGLALVYTGIWTFRRWRTAVYPNRPATLVVETGIYRYTRNPMYLGMTIFYVGVTLLLTSIASLLLLPVVLGVLCWQVIAREERHLRERFPEAYQAYCARVRRWI
jgi:protein-S-isoprenylcysteine O-methyltransferase Ste14